MKIRLNDGGATVNGGSDPSGLIFFEVSDTLVSDLLGGESPDDDGFPEKLRRSDRDRKAAPSLRRRSSARG